MSTDALPPHGDIDVYVANAGLTTMFRAAHSISIDKWRKELDVNLTGTFPVLQQCLPGMRERRYGRVVVISSTAGTQGMPAQVSYSTTKAGLLGLVKTVAADNVALGITTNAVLPGMTASSGIRSMPQDIQDAWLASMPNGFVDLADIAEAVAFFASATARSVTGQLLTVDAGDGLNPHGYLLGGTALTECAHSVHQHTVVYWKTDADHIRGRVARKEHPPPRRCPRDRRCVRGNPGVDDLALVIFG
jgi:NAD(P)-dependent dehydrogenase (short-subunit alcohol dehydrogenase family)